MVTINQAQLRRAVPEVCREEIDSFVASFNQWAIHFGLTTPKRVVHYLAQVFHESGALRYTEEIASGEKYEWRKDLGNTQPGDGKRFKGRAYIQLTGRFNYEKFNKFDLCMKDIVNHPEEVAKFPLNQIASMWFWQTHKLNEVADLDDGGKIGEDIVTRITRKVNGGINGLSQRKLYYRRFKKEFGI